jgi:integrase
MTISSISRIKPVRKLGLRRGSKERRLPQLLADADLKRFFRAIQQCGDVQHEILLKLLFYTAVRVNELVHIEVRDVDLDAYKIFINRGKGQKCVATHLAPYVAFTFMWRGIRRPRPEKAKPRRSAT